HHPGWDGSATIVEMVARLFSVLRGILPGTLSDLLDGQPPRHEVLPLLWLQPSEHELPSLARSQFPNALANVLLGEIDLLADDGFAVRVGPLSEPRTGPRPIPGLHKAGHSFIPCGIVPGGPHLVNKARPS